MRRREIVDKILKLENGVNVYVTKNGKSWSLVEVIKLENDVDVHIIRNENSWSYVYHKSKITNDGIEISGTTFDNKLSKVEIERRLIYYFDRNNPNTYYASTPNYEVEEVYYTPHGYVRASDNFYIKVEEKEIFNTKLEALNRTLFKIKMQAVRLEYDKKILQKV